MASCSRLRNRGDRHRAALYHNPTYFAEMNEQKIELSLPLVNALIQYLGTRPYQEVFSLIVAVQEQAAPQIAPNSQASVENSVIQ